MAYTNVLLIGIAFKALAFFLGCFYVFMDKRYLGGGMTMGEKQRNALEAEIAHPDGKAILCQLFVRVCASALTLPIYCSRYFRFAAHPAHEQEMGDNPRPHRARMHGHSCMDAFHCLRALMLVATTT